MCPSICTIASKFFTYEFKLEQLIFLLMLDAGNHYSEGRKSLKMQFDGKSSFFYVELPEGTILSHSIEDKEQFSVQFGREVINTNYCA